MRSGLSRVAALAAGAVVVIACAGCIGTHGSRAPTWPRSSGSSVLLLDIPGQNPFSSPQACGLNCLWKVLAYYGGADVSAQEIERVLRVDPKRGVADFELASAARRLGYRARFGPSDPEELESALRRGAPVMVLVQRDVERVFGDRFHWAVVHGLDFGRRRVLIDWATQRLSSRPSVDQFIRMWRRGGQRAVFVWRRALESRTIEEAQ